MAEDQLVKVLEERCRFTESMPRIIGSKTYDGLNTDSIRKALGIVSQEPVDASRVLRGQLSEKLYPIAELEEAEFLDTFFQILHCAYPYLPCPQLLFTIRSPLPRVGRWRNPSSRS